VIVRGMAAGWLTKNHTKNTPASGVVQGHSEGTVSPMNAGPPAFASVRGCFVLSLSHGGNRGSNPLRDAKQFQCLTTEINLVKWIDCRFIRHPYGMDKLAKGAWSQPWRRHPLCLIIVRYGF
jgi:hypothetical protein